MDTILSVSVIDSQTFGPALGLLSVQLAQQVAQKCSPEAIDMLLDKQIRIAYQLIAGSSLKYIVNPGLLSLLKTSYHSSMMINELVPFKPVAHISAETGLEVLDMIKYPELVQSQLERYISERLQACGGYLTRVVILHHNMLELATKVEAFIKQLHSQTIVDVCNDDGSVGLMFGPSSLAIAMI